MKYIGARFGTKHFSRFGASVTSIGDIDSDGYNGL